MKNVLQNLKPFYILAKVLGLFPVNFDEKSFKISYNNVVYSVVNILILFFMILMAIFYGYDHALSSEMLSFLWQINSIFGLSLILLQFLIQMKNIKVFPRLIAKLQMFDEKVKIVKNYLKS